MRALLFLICWFLFRAPETRASNVPSSTCCPNERGSVAVLPATAAVPTTAAPIQPCSNSAEQSTAVIGSNFIVTP